MSTFSRARLLSVAAALAIQVGLLTGCAANGEREQAPGPAAQPAAATPAALAPKLATAVASTATDAQVRCVYQPVTGSRVRQKVCRTEADWKQLTTEGQQAVRELQKPIAQGREGG